MKLTYTFKHMDSSEALITRIEERLTRFERYELKPYQAHFSFSMLRHERHCEILLTGPNVRFNAKAKSTDVYEALEDALDKLETQLERRKARVQNHKQKDPLKEFLKDPILAPRKPRDAA